MREENHKNIEEMSKLQWNYAEWQKVETWDSISYKNQNQKTDVKINQN